MNTQKNLINFATFIDDIASEAFDELGSGFKEDTYQKALAISLRKNKVKYLKELNLEIFFKNESLGIFRIDFLIPKQKNKSFNLKEPLIIECKYDTKLSDRHRSQLRQYLKSIPLNSTKELKSIKQGILLNWQKTNVYDETRVAAKTPIQIELWSFDKKNDMSLLFRNYELS